MVTTSTGLTSGGVKGELPIKEQPLSRISNGIVVFIKLIRVG